MEGTWGPKSSIWVSRELLWQRANRMLGCSNKGITSRDKITSPLNPELVRPHLEYWGHSWSLLCKKKDVERLETVQRRTTKMIKELGRCPMRKGWENWGCSAFREEGRHSHHIPGYKEDGNSLFRWNIFYRKTSPGSPQCWTLLRFGWTGCWVILWFCLEMFSHMIPEILSNLVFYGSMKNIYE